MKITAIETVQVEEFSNMLWVRVHTDEGLVGLGETFRNPAAIVAYLHETCAPYLLGRNPLQIERHAPGELAHSLLEDGITAMKIWPFDAYAQASNGHHIAPADLRRGADIVEAIRDAVGDEVDIMLEFHALWHLPAALQIADRLAEHDIYWYEDPIDMANLDDLRRYREGVIGRVAGSENLGSRAWYREAFQRGAIDVAHFDIGWIGGLTEGRKVAVVAETFDRPIAPHGCTGPVQLCANVHMLLAAPNALILETVRAHYRGYYQQIVTSLPRIEQGFAYPMAGPGIGTELQPELLSRADAAIRRSAA